MQVLGKGGKARVLPVGRKAREALQAWYRLRGIGNPRDRAVFITRGATASAHGPFNNG